MSQSTKATGALIDAHLMMVGKLVTNAAVCDAILFSAFRVVSGCEATIASAIYFSSESLPAKKNVVKRILLAVGDSEETEIVGRIMDATTSAHTQRNEVSHALLRASHDGKKILAHNPRRQVQPEKPVTGPSLDGLLKKSSKAYLDAYRAFLELCQKRGIPPTVTVE
ncbi:MAG: hypothetical protein Q8O29_05115 [Polaromonas sp.]|uniref:hypothetical protein n=1 Tax=Polaromonas sp. TaxID=1869339 RepID=UPI00273262B4|nr:hypothetical protein [Polaromonas sp.]MDP2817649.1 hypothetical protein [Polaromonas sp.]